MLQSSILREFESKPCRHGKCGCYKLIKGKVFINGDGLCVGVCQDCRKVSFFCIVCCFEKSIFGRVTMKKNLKSHCDRHLGNRCPFLDCNVLLSDQNVMTHCISHVIGILPSLSNLNDPKAPLMYIEPEEMVDDGGEDSDMSDEGPSNNILPMSTSKLDILSAFY